MTLVTPNWPQERKIFRVRLVGTVLFIVVELLGLLQMNGVVFGILAVTSVALLVLNVWGLKRLWPLLPTVNLVADQLLTVGLLAASGGVAGPLIFISYLHLMSGIVFFGSASVVIPIGLVQVFNLVLSGVVVALTGGQPHPAALSIHALAIMTIASFFAEPAAVLHAAARRDELTGVLNRRSGLEELAHWLELGAPFSLLFADLNAFKRINDEHGHLVGDTVLKHVADALLGSVRGDDLVVRYGGDEFLIATRGDAAPVLARLREAFDQPVLTAPTRSAFGSTSVWLVFPTTPRGWTTSSPRRTVPCSQPNAARKVCRARRELQGVQGNLAYARPESSEFSGLQNSGFPRAWRELESASRAVNQSPVSLRDAW